MQTDTSQNTLTPISKGVYRHYKGNLYHVLGMATHSETLESMVVYQALYGKEEIWVRPACMFRDTVIVSGEPVMRFQLEPEVKDAESATGRFLA